MTIELSVGGMACSGCADSVTKAIKAASPGAEVTVDLAAKRVTVNQAVSRDVVKAAILKAGYDVLG